MRRVLIFLVRAYKCVLSPLFGPACRFVPTCSDYMIECLRKNKLLPALLKGFWRVLRCNPFSHGGYDPVE